MTSLRRVLVASGALTAMLAGASVSNGAALIGSNLSADATNNICTAGVACTYMQTRGGVPSATAPFSGVLTSWRVKSGSGGAVVALRVIHSFGDGKYMERQAITATQTLAAAVNAFPARIAIAQGDAIGLDNASSALLFGGAGEAVYVFNPALVPFATATPAVTVGSVGRELLLNATLEADGDGDGYGDETQDGCPTDRLRQAPPCAPAFAVTGVRFNTSPRVLRLSRRPSRGTFGFGVTFRTSRPATARLAVAFIQPGRKFAGTCVPAAVLASGPACALNHVVRDVRATIGVAGTTLGHRISVDARRLRAGTYRATLTVGDRLGPGVVTRTFVVRIRA